MAITKKLNEYLIKKMARSKCNYLFAVSKEYLFTKIHELNQQVEYLGLMNDNLSTKVEILQTKNNTLKTQIQGDTDVKYRLAYERLTEKYESLINENKAIKKTLDVVNKVVDDTQKQNEKLKHEFKIVTAQNNKLITDNQELKKETDQKKIVKINKADIVGIRKGYTANTKTSSKISLSR